MGGCHFKAQGFKWGIPSMYFFRVMPIQREWHCIDWQADREAVDQMLPVLATMGKTRLHATCHFYSAVVIKASLLHLFFTNRGRPLGASSRFKTWSLVFWCLLTETLQVIWWSASTNQYNYNRSSPDTLTTHNLCSCSKGFETITLKSIHGFKLGSAKSMFALFYFYFFTFLMIFPLQTQCVCVCVCVCVSALFKLYL